MSFAKLLPFLHLVLLPFIIYFVYRGNPLVALLLLTISAISDIVGKIMRKSTISFLHPFSDKIMILTLLLVLVLQELFSSLILGIFVLRDIIIGYVRMRAARDDVVIRGELYGKMITLLQFVMVFLVLGEEVFPPLTNPFTLVLSLFTAVAIILGVISIIHYSYVYAKGLKTRRELGKVIEQEKIIILANPKSGGYRDAYRRHLLKVFAKRRNAPIYFLSGKNLFAPVKRKIEGSNHVIIAGGDGTFEAALNNRWLQGRSLGFFPLGAGNSLYSYFYKGKRFEYLRSRFKFREVPLDVLEVQWQSAKKETLFLSVGADAEVVQALKTRKRHSFENYVTAGAKVIFGAPVGYDLECQIDRKKYHWNNAVNLILGKVPYLGFGVRSLLGTAKDDDGFILGMACVNTHAPFFNKALRLWGMFLTQMGLAKAPLIPLKGKEFVVKSKKPFPLQAGGDFVEYTRWIKVKVRRKQKVLMI